MADNNHRKGEETLSSKNKTQVTYSLYVQLKYVNKETFTIREVFDFIETVPLKHFLYFVIFNLCYIIYVFSLAYFTLL